MPGLRFGLLLLSTRGLDVEGMRADIRAALELLGRGHYERPTEPGELPSGHTQTAVTSDGRIVVPEGTAPQGLSEAIRRYFPKDVWGDAARVSFYESGWKHDAALDTRHLAGGQCGARYWNEAAGMWATTEYSIGYFQINSCAHGGGREQWEDTDNNVRKAAELYHAAGDTWRDWLYTANHLGLLE